MANKKTASSTKKSSAKSAASKKNTSKKNTAKKTSAKAKQQEFSFYELNRTKIMLAYFLFSALMLMIAFLPGYNIWANIRGAFFGFFGFGFDFLGVLFLVLGIRIAIDSFHYGLLKTTISAFAMTAIVSSISHLFTNSIHSGGASEWAVQLKDAASAGYYISEDGFSMTGGIIGAFFGGGLLHAIGKTASIIIFILLLVFCVIIFLNISFSALGNSLSSLIVTGKDKASEGVSEMKVKHGENKVRRKEEKEERRQQLRIEREARLKELEERRLERERREISDFDFNSTDVDNNFDGRNMSGEFPKYRREMRTPARRESIFTTYVPPENPQYENDALSYEEKFDEEKIIEDVSSVDFTTPENDPEAFSGFYEDVINEVGEVASYEKDESNLSSEATDLVEQAASSAQRLAKKNQSEVEKYTDEPKREYAYPPIECLAEPDFSREEDYAFEMRSTASKLVDTLKSFGVETTLIGVSRGPSVTRYELQPAPGVKISKITNLADDIALNLAASGVRIEAPIPNKSAVGIEVPNQLRSTVTLREIISSSEFKTAKSKLNVALGKDITGDISCADLAKMPHLLIAGTTGSGKSVCLNCMIVSILYKAKPSEVKLLMIDPKQVEFSVYNGIPHLLVPVISDVRKAAGSLAWAVGEMENRYKIFSACGVRDIGGYNRFCKTHLEYDPMAQIVIFIDELNDLMMVSPKEVEDSICRLAQKARAAGMHLVVATQRPSVDVITGIIKANIPSRISLSVSSQVDSRTILDTIGAEKLLGNGDMLFNPIGVSKPVRVQGAYVADEEIEEIVEFLKEQEEVEYDNTVMDEIEKNAAADNKKIQAAAGSSVGDNGGDELLESAIETAIECEAISVSLLQRRLRIGYARAARIVDELDEMGLVGPSEGGGKPRKFLMTKAQFLEMKASKDNASSSSGDESDDFDIFGD